MLATQVNETEKAKERSVPRTTRRSFIQLDITSFVSRYSLEMLLPTR